MKQVSINLYLDCEPTSAELSMRLDEVKYFIEQGYLFGEGWDVEVEEF